MVRLRLPEVLLVAALGLGPAIGLSGPACASCCPSPDKNAPSLSALACCGQGCAKLLSESQDRPCLTSARSDAVRAQAIPAPLAPIVSLLSQLDIFHPRALWLPASARSGTNPLRL